MRVLRRVARRFHRENLGQDVAEYCLMTALIALIGLGIFWHVSGGLQGMWNSMNSSLAAGNATTGVAAPASTGLSGN